MGQFAAIIELGFLALSVQILGFKLLANYGKIFRSLGRGFQFHSAEPSLSSRAPEASSKKGGRPAVRHFLSKSGPSGACSSEMEGQYEKHYNNLKDGNFCQQLLCDSVCVSSLC